MSSIFHALILHLHQPPDNLQLLIDTNPKEAELIIYCYDRITRFAHNYINIGNFHIAISGLLLRQLQQPEIIKQYRQHIDIPAMLEGYRIAKNIEFIGMGMYHPIFPLIPESDWELQLRLERDLIIKTFGRAPRGFLPPEMAFNMRMIPSLVQAGYEYVLVDSASIKPEHGQVDVFQPYTANYQDHSITIIPINRDISSAQQTGLDPVWFAHQVRQQVANSAHPQAARLVASWSNGENGRWFRNEETGFFGQFVAPYMEHSEYGEYPIRTVRISEYLQQHPATIAAWVETGAWNMGSTSGYGLADWGGSELQQAAIAKLRALSQNYDKINALSLSLSSVHKSILATIKQDLLLAQSSCYLFWGEEWLVKLFDLLKPIEAQLSELETIYLPSAPKQVTIAKNVAQDLTVNKKIPATKPPLRPADMTEPPSTESAPSSETPPVARPKLAQVKASNANRSNKRHKEK